MPSVRIDGDDAARELLCELLRLLHANGWASGTGGGICAMTARGLLVAPTGVHKERVRPEDFFVVDADDGAVQEPPADTALKPSECTPIFAAIVRERGAGSVVHSHALSAVLAADHGGEDGALAIGRLEMLKGLRGVSNADRHEVAVIANTAREPELTGAVERALADERFSAAHAVLVRDHGAYIWGNDIWEAKRHAETYHFLFEATNARRR